MQSWHQKRPFWTPAGIPNGTPVGRPPPVRCPGPMLWAMERITLAEAAQRVGTTPAILRKRAQRGTLTGAVKVDGAWFVETPAGTPGQDKARPTRTPDGTDAGARWPDLVAALQQENGRLWGELEARRREVERLHTLLAQAQARVLPPATEVTTPASTAPQTPPEGPRRRHWWHCSPEASARPGLSWRDFGLFLGLVAGIHPDATVTQQAFDIPQGLTERQRWPV